MAPLLIITLVTYLAVAYFAWSDKTIRPPLLLLAATIATFIQPLWSFLLGTPPDVPGNVVRVGTSVILPTWTILGGGVLLALPPLLVFYGLRHSWWNQHYAANWGFFLAFVIFFFAWIAFETSSDIILFARPNLPGSELVEALLQSLMLASISFGLLYAFVTTRHYALQIALVPLLASGLAASLLLIGVLSSPFWVAQILRSRVELREQFVLAAAVVSVVLVLWAIHLLASGLHAGRRQRLQWR